MHNAYATRWNEADLELLAALVAMIDWERDPTLSRLVRANNSDSLTERHRGGLHFYLTVAALGDTTTKPVQRKLAHEWASSYNEAHDPSYSGTRVLSNAHNAEAVIEKLSNLLELYEQIAAFEHSPPEDWIEVTISLLDAVPQMKDWTGAQRLSFAADDYEWPERSEWLAAACKHAKRVMPAANSLIRSSLDMRKAPRYTAVTDSTAANGTT